MCPHDDCIPLPESVYNPFDPLAKSMVALFDSNCGFDNRLDKDEARNFFFFALTQSGSVYDPEEFEEFWW